MKVYAIKRDDGKYLKITINPYNDFNEDEFVNDLYEATLYASYDLEYAEYKCEDLRGCQVVECELMEANELTDHDKKVKDKLLEDVWEIMEKITFDWYENDDNINSELYIDADDIADILTDFETMSKEEVIEKHKWRFDKSVENSQDTQKSSTGGEE